MKRQIRFRASIYLDIWIDETKEQVCDCEIQPCIYHNVEKSIEEMRQEAREQVEEIVDQISQNEENTLIVPEGIFNPYVGDVAKYDPRNLLKPLDRDI